MKKILKCMKKLIIPLIIILILLTIQAQADLALPDYMAKIINIGIVQSGIEYATPEMVRYDEMNYLLMFTDSDDEILSHYSLSDDYYSLNENTTAKKEELHSLFLLPNCAVMTVRGLDDEKREEFLMALSVEEQGSETDLVKIIYNLPEPLRDGYITAVNAILETLEIEDAIMRVTAASYVRAEYTALKLDVDSMQSKYIFISGITMLGFSLLIIAASILISYFSSQIAAKFSRNLRETVFKKIVGFSGREFDGFSSASLITRCTNDIQQIQMLIVMLFRMVLYAPILGIGALFKIGGSSMMWVIGVAILAILILITALLIFAMPKFNSLQKLIDKLNLVSKEILSGVPVIRAFSREKHEEERFAEANKNLTSTNLFVNRSMATMMPLMMFIMNSVSILIMWVGASKIDSGLMRIGDMSAFIQYSMMIIVSFLMLSMISIMLPRSIVSAKRIAEVLNTESSIPVVSASREILKGDIGTVEFRNVSFRYPNANKDVIHNISFKSSRGETTAVIGSTGAGKTTLINLIPRFYDATEGEVLVNGVNVRELTMHDLRSNIGYVPQKSILFTGTIESNIAYGLNKMNNKKVETAAKIAQASEFISEKDEKYKSEISQGGTNVSGGQRQRLSIARAIAKNPSIYIFDDSFSALDYATDIKLREAMSDITKNSTVLIVAQRISTVLNATRIIVLDEGIIVGTGNHNELMKSCETYRQIALSQISEEEASR